jgi:hypothetical protein
VELAADASEVVDLDRSGGGRNGATRGQDGRRSSLGTSESPPAPRNGWALHGSLIPRDIGYNRLMLTDKSLCYEAVGWGQV